MSESTLNLTSTQLQAEVGFFLGFGRGSAFNEPAWSARQQQGITDCVNSGLRMFYFPTPLPGETSSYDWSFMRPTRQVAMQTGVRVVPLPDDFGGLEGDLFLVNSTNAFIQVKQTNEGEINAKYFAYPSMSGQPIMFAVQQPSTMGAAKSQRAQLYIFPESDQAYTLQFQYYFLPDSLSVSFPYALGGTTHAETIKAAVKAAAELHQDNQPGPMAQLFIQRMQASISLDRRNKGQTFGMNNDPGYNRGQYTGRLLGNIQVPITFYGSSPG